MPVRFGIVCDWCRKLHLISDGRKSSRLHYDRLRGEFKMTCIPPCQNVILFSKEMLLAYVVTDEAVHHGCAELDDCRPLAKIQNARVSVPKRSDRQ